MGLKGAWQKDWKGIKVYGCPLHHYPVLPVGDITGHRKSMPYTLKHTPLKMLQHVLHQHSKSTSITLFLDRGPAKDNVKEPLLLSGLRCLRCIYDVYDWQGGDVEIIRGCESGRLHIMIPTGGV